MNELEIGKYFYEPLGFPDLSEEENNDGGSEKVGTARLGSEYFRQNAGVTLILITILMIIIALLILAVFCCAKMCDWTKEKKEKLQSLKDKVLFNMPIKYTQLNSLKLNLAAIVACTNTTGGYT